MLAPHLTHLPLSLCPSFSSSSTEIMTSRSPVLVTRLTLSLAFYSLLASPSFAFVTGAFDRICSTGSPRLIRSHDSSIALLRRIPAGPTQLQPTLQQLLRHSRPQHAVRAKESDDAEEGRRDVADVVLDEIWEVETGEVSLLEDEDFPCAGMTQTRHIFFERT